MYWHEEKESELETPEERVVDLLFSIECPTLPVDHAWALSNAINRELDWFESDPLCGLHLIHGAETGNGWERPSGEGELLNLSRRTKLRLRLPTQRIGDANRLIGKSLDIDGHRLLIKGSKTQSLSKSSVLYARYVAQQEAMDEEAFIKWAVQQLKQQGLRFKKILCGKENQMMTEEGPLHTRSLMVADLPLEDAIRLQESGLGPRRTMGCGLFVPQKSF